MLSCHSFPYAVGEFLVCEKDFASGPRDLRVGMPLDSEIIGSRISTGTGLGFQRVQGLDFDGEMGLGNWQVGSRILPKQDAKIA